MRRFFAFVMCLSGFTLAVSWTKADEPATAAAADEAQPASEAAPARPAEPPQPPSRPVVIRTEPGRQQEDAGADDSIGRRRRELQQRFDELRAAYVTPEFIEQQQRRLEKLQDRLEHAAENYSGPALEQVQELLESQIARIEATLEEVVEQRAAATAHAGPADHGHSHAHGDPERREEPISERLRSAFERAEGNGRAGAGMPPAVEERIQQLRKLADDLAQSGLKEAESARQEIENQIDKLERYLAERRERREAAERAARREQDDAHADAHDRELAERLQHIEAAFEHLKAAGMDETAAHVREQAAELKREFHVRQILRAQQRGRQQQRDLQRNTAELQQQRARAAQANAEAARSRAHELQRGTAAAEEAAAGPAGVGALAEQLRDLRRELRHLRQEVQELRDAHAESREQ